MIKTANQNFRNNNSIKVLLIEDDMYIRQLYEDTFDMEPGYKLIPLKIEEMKNVEEVVGNIRKIKPEVILLDLILPLKSNVGGYLLDEEVGFGILEELKKDKELSKIPVIIVSNLSGFLEKERGKVEGAEIYLVKSEIFPSQIVSIVEKVLTQSH